MTRNPIQALLTLMRVAVPTVISLLGLTAVIVGILAMHVWMGGHGSTSHHLAAPATGTAVEFTDAGNDAVHDHPNSRTPGITALTADALPSGTDAHDTSQAIGSVASGHISDTMSNATWNMTSEGGSLGCGRDCADEMMLGMCVLALIAVGLALLLIPSNRAMLPSMSRAGPPSIVWTSRPPAAPSLTQLCISRT